MPSHPPLCSFFGVSIFHGGLPTLRKPSSSARPAVQPSSRPAVQPSSRPAVQPSSRPAVQPSSRPAVQPSGHVSKVRLFGSPGGAEPGELPAGIDGRARRHGFVSRNGSGFLCRVLWAPRGNQPGNQVKRMQRPRESIVWPTSFLKLSRELSVFGMTSLCQPIRFPDCVNLERSCPSFTPQHQKNSATVAAVRGRSASPWSPVARSRSTSAACGIQQAMLKRTQLGPRNPSDVFQQEPNLDKMRCAASSRVVYPVFKSSLLHPCEGLRQPEGQGPGTSDPGGTV